jgi:hypothetical protein
LNFFPNLVILKTFATMCFPCSVKMMEHNIELLYKDHRASLFDEEVLGKIKDLEFKKKTISSWTRRRINTLKVDPHC